MQTAFEELNLYAYHTVQGVFYDVLIWCLGPFVEESREYGLARCLLANLTCRLCRRWFVKP
jgi:hypothetical protein